MNKSSVVIFSVLFGCFVCLSCWAEIDCNRFISVPPAILNEYSNLFYLQQNLTDSISGQSLINTSSVTYLFSSFWNSNALYIPSSANPLSFPSAAYFTPSFTISFWVQFVPNGVYPTYFINTGNPTLQIVNYQLYYSRIALVMQGYSIDNPTAYAPIANQNISYWTHVVVTVQNQMMGSQGYIYINGTAGLPGSVTTTYEGSGSNPIYLGSEIVDISLALAGSLRCVMIWQGALNSMNVAQLFNNQLTTHNC